MLKIQALFIPRSLVAVVLLATGLAAGAAAPGQDVAGAPVEASTAGPGLGQQAVMHALSLLGVHYKFGGNVPDTGLDCSGLVRHVFREVAGVVLPRRSADMRLVGEAVEDPAQLRPGDLVFFRNIGRLVSHVGIYIGDNAFVHAASQRSSVRVDRIDESHWRSRFVAARRVTPGDTLPDAGPVPAVLREAPVRGAQHVVPVAGQSARARHLKPRHAAAAAAKRPQGRNKRAPGR